MTRHIKTLDDFDAEAIFDVALRRFQCGFSISNTAVTTWLTKYEVRQIENAILDAVQKGETGRLDKETVEAAKRMLKERDEKQTDAGTSA